MSSSFTVEDLAQSTIPQALPLLRATWPRVDLASWQDFADRFRPEGSGATAITAMFDSAGSLCGLFAWRIEHWLDDGEVFAVPLFTVVDVGNSLQPVRTLLDAAKTLGQKHGCARLEIRLDEAQRKLLKRLQHLGMEFTQAVGSTAIGMTCAS